MKLATLVLCVGLLSTATSFAQGPPPASPAVIITTGEGVVKRAPDRAWVAIAVENRASTAPEAQRLNTDAMTAVIARIKAAGVPADAVQTTGYNLQPVFDYANGKQTLRGYLAHNQVEVRVDTLAKTGDIIAAAVSTGATNVSGVRFDLKDRDGLEREALRLAVRDARARADAAAAGAGVTIDRILKIEEAGAQQEAPVAMQASRMSSVETLAVSGPVPMEAGELDVRARVTLTVAIK